MNNWIKIESEIFICISNDHQITIDNQWTTSYFSFDVKSNINYLPKFLNYYDNKISFNWEDNKSRGIGSSIKFFDIYNDVVTLTVRSKEWGIKDKSYERNLRLDEILPVDKTYDNDKDIIKYVIRNQN
jgi:hypothetical protein